MNKNYLIKRELFILSREQQIKDHYEFIKEVGKGAYGKVYLARLKVFPHYLRVVKVISKKNMRNPTIVLNEIKIMGRLDHPNIVKLYETFEDQHHLFLVLDYCSGNQLYDRLSTCQTFNQQKARLLFQQMVVTRICHRDLKLENFMMENESSWGIRMIDFGLSFGWKQDMREEMKNKEERRLIGTCYYMSPQVLAFSYDERCDIWALGVILYMMVTGTPPFQGQREVEIMENIKCLNYSLKTPECLQLSPSLLDLISKMLKPQKYRISLQDICQHPWYTSDTVISQQPLKIEFSRLKNFSKYSKLKKIVATYISTNLSGNQMQEMRRIFESIDNNRDGYLSYQQFRQYFQNQRISQVPLADIQKLLKSVDMDNNGKVNYNEFMTSCLDQSILSSQSYLQYVFNSFDINRDGKIQRQEFNLILKCYSSEFRCNLDLVQELIRENDRDKDGAINFQEFSNSIRYIQQMSSKKE